MVHEHEGVIIDGRVIVRECQQPDRRWPLTPLLEQVGGTHSMLVKRGGVSGRDVARAAELGLSDRQADHWALRCGLHPAMVWPGWAAAALTPLDDQFINRGGWRPAYLHLEHTMTRGPQQPDTDAHIREDGTVSSRCWCDTRTVRVTPADVRAGRTKSCGATDDLTGRETCTPDSIRQAG
jgi:hypothetical protein